jgi:hypothetical protein
LTKTDGQHILLFLMVASEVTSVTLLLGTYMIDKSPGPLSKDTVGELTVAQLSKLAVWRCSVENQDRILGYIAGF